MRPVKGFLAATRCWARFWAGSHMPPIPNTTATAKVCVSWPYPCASWARPSRQISAKVAKRFTLLLFMGLLSSQA